MTCADEKVIGNPPTSGDVNSFRFRNIGAKRTFMCLLNSLIT
jgi:hypothetical protein